MAFSQLNQFSFHFGDSHWDIYKTLFLNSSTAFSGIENHKLRIFDGLEY